MASKTDKDRPTSQIKRTKNTSIEAFREEKIKLRKDIQELKALNFEMECSLKMSKFGDIEHLLQSSELSSSGSLLKITPDVETEYTDELFQLAGMHCTKLTENEYIFGFVTSGDSKSKDRNYAIQIMSDSGKPNLGKWAMPMAIDLNSLLEETPLRDATDLKLFLANCKYHIDCYANRLKQYNELQLIFEELSGCNLDSNLGYTVITLKLFDVQIVESYLSYNVILYLIYPANRVRPLKMVIDSSNGTRFSDDIENKFRSYFKHFKRFELKDAFEETCKVNDGPVKWMREQESGNLELNDDVSSGSGERQRPGKRKPTHRGLKRKIKETSLPIQGSASQEQRSDDSDAEETIVPGSSLAKSMEKEKQNSLKTQVKRHPAKKKKKLTRKVAEKATPAAPQVEKTSQVTKTGKTNLKPSQNTSRRSLRQSTLRVQFEQTKDKGQPKSGAATKTGEQISPIHNDNVQQKSQSKVEALRNIEFGTSTPVFNSNLKQKQFIPLISPIRPKSNLISKTKLLAKILE